ncbi:MAG TPA: SLC13 family permease [Candidatus Atribacteria bacterium]|nr:SLC13 family permease [Candidatus Atribacteria bacterium]
MLTYVLLLAFPKVRAHIALVSAGIFVLLATPRFSAYFGLDWSIPAMLGNIDWNVILMIAGTMGTVYLFIESRMPALLADLLIEKTPNVKWAIISLALFASIVSAFIDNVATVLMVAPVAIDISKKLKMSPVPSIIAISISSNLQGAATLVGDTTSILLGAYANLDFMDFFVYRGKPGLFWVVQAGAVVSTLVLLYVFRREKQRISTKKRTRVTDYFPTFLLVGTIALLILASFVPEKPAITNGLICMGLFIVGLLRDYSKTGSFDIIKDAFREIDYFTIALLTGLFVVIGGIKEAGVVDAIGQFLANISGGNVFVVYTLIVWSAVLLSAFIDNIPYVATMLPVTAGLAQILNVDPTLLYFGLLTGATLGGNLTPIGASANITGLGILRREGHEVRAWDFMKISIPFTLSAVTTGYLLVWLLWSLEAYAL